MLEVKNTEVEINTFDRLINRMDTAEERIGEIKDRSIRTAWSKMQRGKKILDKNPKIQELWDNFQNCNMCITGIPEGGGKGAGEIFE